MLYTKKDKQTTTIQAGDKIIFSPISGVSPHCFSVTIVRNGGINDAICFNESNNAIIEPCDPKNLMKFLGQIMGFCFKEIEDWDHGCKAFKIIDQESINIAGLKKKKEALLKKLHEITVERVSDTVSKIIQKVGSPVEINTNYDAKIFGFLAGEFVQHCDQLLLCVGVGEGCHRSGLSLWFLEEGKDGIIFYGNLRNADFEAKGFKLV